MLNESEAPLPRYASIRPCVAFSLGAALTSGACLLCAVCQIRNALLRTSSAQSYVSKPTKTVRPTLTVVSATTPEAGRSLSEHYRLVVHRDRVIRELLETERFYVNGLHNMVFVRARLGWSSNREPPLTADYLLTHGSARTAAVSSSTSRDRRSTLVRHAQGPQSHLLERRGVAADP